MKITKVYLCYKAIFSKTNRYDKQYNRHFYTQARQHKSLKAFYYNRNYELGSGKDLYPLLWLEDPLTGHNRGNVFSNSANFSVLLLPDKGHSTASLQSLAFSIGLNIIERIKNMATSWGSVYNPTGAI